MYHISYHIIRLFFAPLLCVSAIHIVSLSLPNLMCLWWWGGDVMIYFTYLLRSRVGGWRTTIWSQININFTSSAFFLLRWRQVDFDAAFTVNGCMKGARALGAIVARGAYIGWWRGRWWCTHKSARRRLLLLTWLLLIIIPVTNCIGRYRWETIICWTVVYIILK